MGNFLEFDYRQLQESQQEIRALIREGDSFLRQAITNIAQRAISKIKKRTPVDTGTLRNAWKITRIIKVGGQYIALISNATAYAEYVEYGHRIIGRAAAGPRRNVRRGKKKKYKVKKTEWKAKVENGFVKGRFMMTISMWEIEREMDRIVQLEFEKWLRSRLER